jgi:hypothetical protein
MKKLLLLASLFLSFTINAQPPGSMPPLSVCDSNNDGFAAFDLNSQIPAILNGLNPATSTVTFHETQTSAQTGTDAIANTNSYVNISSFIQTIFIRVVDNATSDIYFSTIDIRVNPTPSISPGSLTFCDPMELAIYNLNNADNQITGGVAGLTVSYYETLIDAQTGANQVGIGGYIPLINPGQQILFAQVFNPVTGCASFTTLTLNTQNCGTNCPAPINLVASAITDTTFAFSFTNIAGSIGYSMACITPVGSMPSDNGAVTITGPGPYVFTGLNPNTCYEVYAKVVCTSSSTSAWSSPLTVCTSDCVDSGNCSQALILTPFLDSNNNGIKDSGESNFTYGNFVYQINDSGDNNTLYGMTTNGSYYIFDTNPTNSYDFSFVVNSQLSGYYTSAVSHNNITIPTGSGATYLYFPIVNTVPYLDARVTLTPGGQPRPGFQYSNFITYQNYGPQTIASGTITYTHQSNISITSISQTGTTATANGFTYNFTNLAPFEIRQIQVGLLVPTIPTVSLGDLVTNNATIQVNNDTNLSNNSSTLAQVIVGSYDPNDKCESHGGKIVHGNFTSNDYLYYTIQFENTGSASAEFVKVVDLLNNQLDETTFEMLTASHAVNSKREGNLLTWHFYDINLPPTSSNPTGSHGYITFRIKPKSGYAIGDIIPNAASIYFDYNPAIVTDTYSTEFVQSMGIGTFNPDTISMSPNPASNMVTITNNNIEKISKVIIYEITGKRVFALNNNMHNSISIEVSSLSKGMYMVELTSENNTKITKKLILN